MSHDQQAGAVKLGCLFSLALVLAFSYVCYQVIPVYYHAGEFQNSVEQEVSRAGAKYVGDQVLKENILNLARIHRIPLEQKNLQIIRAGSQVAVDVQYSVQVDFPLYSHVFQFQFRVQSAIGAL